MKYSSDGESGTLVSQFGYTGQLYLPDLQLYYYKARMYSPKAGRFLQPDPIGYADGMNLYGYVANDPINGTDPLGLTKEMENSAFCDQMSGMCIPSAALNPFAPNGCDADCQAGQGLNWIDKIHFGLNGASVAMDVSGVGAAFSWIPDVADGIVSLAEGDLTGAGMSAVAAIPGFGIVSNAGKITRITNRVVTGQIHHAISKTVHKALDAHPNLKGAYSARDSRFVTQAKDLAAHNGYDRFHRNLDAEVAGWVRSNPNATAAQFESYLRGVYQRPDMLAKFPNGL